MALTPAEVKVADHNGLAVLVCVRVKDGSPGVIDCRRVELIEPGLPKRPYEHETAGMHVAEAEGVQDRDHTSESRALLDGPVSIVFMSNS